VAYTGFKSHTPPHSSERCRVLMRAAMSATGTSISIPTSTGVAVGAGGPMLLGAGATMLCFAALGCVYTLLNRPPPDSGARPGRAGRRTGSRDYGDWDDDEAGSVRQVGQRRGAFLRARVALTVHTVAWSAAAWVLSALLHPHCVLSLSAHPFGDLTQKKTRRRREGAAGTGAWYHPRRGGE
jgi:hypothetical protein